MAGEPLSNFPLRAPYPAGVGPDTPLPLADPLTLADPRRGIRSRRRCCPSPASPASTRCWGPEMRSTGEVMGWDRTFALAFLKAQMGAGTTCPRAGGCSSRSATPTRPTEMARPRATCRRWASRWWRRAARRLAGARGIACTRSTRSTRAAEHRRPAEERRDRAGLQHHRGRAGGRRQPRHPRRRADGQDPLFHHRRRRPSPPARPRRGRRP
jgi:hypothetical protein